MKKLSHPGLEILLSAVEELNCDADTKTLPERALAAASKIIVADSVVFTRISYSDNYSGMVWENAEALSPADMEIFGAYLHEHPLFTALNVERRIETLKITDLVSRQEFYRTNLYNELYRRIKIANQLITPLLISDDFFVACSINTSKADFSERDKIILMMLAPHLVSAIRNSFAYERLNFALETENCGIISINSSGKTLFVSEPARQMLETYFAGEKREANSLPETLASWLKRIELTKKTTEFDLPPEPFKIKNQIGTLIIRLMYNSASRERMLMLEETKHSTTVLHFIVSFLFQIKSVGAIAPPSFRKVSFACTFL